MKFIHTFDMLDIKNVLKLPDINLNMGIFCGNLKASFESYFVSHSYISIITSKINNVQVNSNSNSNEKRNSILTFNNEDFKGSSINHNRINNNLDELLKNNHSTYVKNNSSTSTTTTIRNTTINSSNNT